MAGSEQIVLELKETLRTAEELRRPILLANARLDDYDAVYYPLGISWQPHGCALPI